MPSLPPRPAVLTPTEYRNICKCRHTSVAEKRAYLSDMAKCGVDRAKAEVAHSGMRKGKLRAGGKPASILPDEGLGVLVSPELFVSKTAKSFGMLPSTLKRKFKNWLSYEMKRLTAAPLTDSEMSDAWAFRDADIPTRQDGEIWLFRNPERKSDAFEGVLDRWLAARLGLNFPPDAQRLTFGFPARAVSSAAEPTFFDPPFSYLKLWHWSGRTRPLPGTPASHKGLEEVVADPPKLRDLNRPVLSITMKAP